MVYYSRGRVRTMESCTMAVWQRVALGALRLAGACDVTLCDSLCSLSHAPITASSLFATPSHDPRSARDATRLFLRNCQGGSRVAHRCSGETDTRALSCIAVNSPMI